MSMSVAQTQATLMAYAQVLLSHQRYADFFSDDVTYTIMNTGNETRGRAAVEQRIDADHAPASDIRVKNAVFGEGQAAVEAEFVGKDGTITPYSVIYDFAEGKITALRLYFAGKVPT